MRKKGFLCFLVGLSMALACAGLSSCGLLPDVNNSESSGNSESSVEESSSSSSSSEEAKITINGATSVTEFETLTLTASVTGTDANVAWSSSDTSVATVENGVVTALKAGTVIITATAGEVTATHTVKVEKTTIAHEIEFSVSSLSLYEEEQESVSVSVKYDGKKLDEETYGIAYTWSVTDGDADVAELTQNGASATVLAKKVGSVTYTVTTTVRGYEVRKTFTINVLETTLSLGFTNDAICPSENESYALSLKFGETEDVTLGDVVLVKNGTPTETKMTLTWSSEEKGVATYSQGKFVAQAAGTETFTGTATYNDETLTLTLVVTVAKGEASLTGTTTMETANATFTLPEGVEGTVVKVTVNESNVIYDSANAKGSLNGTTLTPYTDGLPAKMSELGKGKTMTVETEKTIYTATVDVYTMIIDTKAELDSWQSIAADNAVRAGVCLEAQKGHATSGYFLLGSDIEYNGVWKPYMAYNQIWGVSTANTTLANTLKDESGNYIEGVIDEDWGRGIAGGFQGIFDGCGHNIDGLETSGKYSGFIVTNGKNGVVQNLSFTNATVGAEAGLVVERGQGTVRNVYMHIKKFNEDAVTFFKAGNGPVRTVESVLIDVTDCKLTELSEKSLLGSYCDNNGYNGVYVIGAADSLSEKLFGAATNAVVGGFATQADLLADETHGENVKAWDTTFWAIGEKYALPKSIVDNFKGDFTFENTKNAINAGWSEILGTTADAKYIEYSLESEVDGVTLSGNTVIVSETATAGTTVTVVATSIIDGKTATYTFTIAAYAEAANVIAPAENAYYAFTGESLAPVGGTYTFTLTGKVKNCNDFVVFANDTEVTGNNGTYTVENVTGDLTIKVLHGYIECESNVTVTYNDDGSIKFEKIVPAESNNNNGWISKDYINYMIGKGYKKMALTITLSDPTLANTAMVTGGGLNFSLWQANDVFDTKVKTSTLNLPESVTDNLKIWLQHNGSGWKVQEGGYMILSGLQFIKDEVAVTAPATSSYYTFNGATVAEKGSDYTFTLTSKVSGCNEFIVFVNDEEVTATNGMYTVKNVTEALTIKVLHGYIEHGANVTVTYNEDGSIIVKNAVFANSFGTDNGAWGAWISADYINYMISQGYTKVQVYIKPDFEISNQAIVNNGTEGRTRIDTTYNSVAELSLVQDKTVSFSVQKDGSGNNIKNQDGYMTITNLTFAK